MNQPMQDPISEMRLATLHPSLINKVRGAAVQLALINIYFRVAQGLRNCAEQDALYAKGRTAPGPVVTKAKGGYSNHNFGMAVDCFPFVAGNCGPIDLNDPKAPEFMAMVGAMKWQGLVWGGDWHSIADPPHFQLDGVPVTPTDEDRAAFAHGGYKAVWGLYPDV